MENLKRFIDAQVQFGHKTSNWNPKTAFFIWGQKGGIHIINIAETEKGLERAKKFLRDIAEQGKQVLLVGTKKAAQKSIEEVAKKTGMPYVNQRWVGGTFTNFPHVKKSFTRFGHMQDVLAKSSDFSYTKKELSTIQKSVERLQKNIGGITSLKHPGALLLIDIKKDHTALREARAANIPVVALVDTNDNPLGIDFVIPSNNDAQKAIALMLQELGQAIQEGVEIAKSKPVQAVETMQETDTIQPFFMEEDEDKQEENGRSKKSAVKQVRTQKAGARKQRPTSK